MSYKKLLIIILIVIGAMFALMLTTSFAWYSYENASTSFDISTHDDEVLVTYSESSEISTFAAVPLRLADVDEYSDKTNFTVSVSENALDEEIIVSVSLVDITIDPSLQNSSFKIDLFHQGTIIASVGGDQITGTTKLLGNTVLDNEVDNNFELRVYILDNNGDQSDMMDKTFQAKIKVDVVSRVATKFNTFDNPDIYVSSIMIDGEESDSLPTSGLYDMTASCLQGSELSWDALSKTLVYEKGSYVNDTCSLTFTSSDAKTTLSEVPVGSYVSYVGNNGCSGKACAGQNANYVNDMKMGYCSNSKFQYTANGWRVGYVKDKSAYLVSAGSVECMSSYIENKGFSASNLIFNTAYYYGTGYTFHSSTGKYSLTGVTDNVLDLGSNYEQIINNTPYTCKDIDKNGTCNILYEIVDYNVDSASVEAYSYTNYANDINIDSHIEHLNDRALKYCNSDLVHAGKCDNDNVWVLRDSDFKNILQSTMSLSLCYGTYGNKNCGFANNLIDNGGFYWYSVNDTNMASNTFYWNPSYRGINRDYSSNDYGLRPVIKLDSTVYITGGSGTYDDPYIIEK